jgi:hypothetical protein
VRSVITKGGTVAIIVMAAGAAAGQNQSGPIHAILRTPSPAQAVPMSTALNHMAIVNRLLSLDRNGDDRIARGELPERMEDLVGRGDKNQDGFLTMDEVFALVDTRPPVGAVRFRAHGAASVDEIIADLKLPPVTHDRAVEIVKDLGVLRNTDDPVNAKIYAAMRELLGNEDYENFVAATARLRKTLRVFPGGIAGGIVGGIVATPTPPRR